MLSSIHLLDFETKIIYLFVLIAIILIAYKFYRFWFVNQLFTDLDHTVFNKKHLDVKSYYNQDELIASYPNVWYPLILSSDLPPGQVKPINIFEKDLVVFRSMSGKVHVLDAYCPHQGAHLGIGGSVVGEHIRCPFHCWTFDGLGVCTSVPGLESSNTPKTKIKNWNCIELNHWIFVWYHNQNESPRWTPPKIQHLDTAQFCGGHEFFLNCHILDIYGNVFDQVHFDQIHSVAGLVSDHQLWHRGPIYQIVKKIFKFDYHQIIEKDLFKYDQGDDKKCLSIDIKVTPVLLGFKLNLFQLSVTMSLGPTVIYGHYKSSLLKTSMFNIFALQPISDHRWRAIGEFIILNNKKFMKPQNQCMTKLDKLQANFFRWFIKNHF